MVDDLDLLPDSSANEVFLWHGTRGSLIDYILRDGLDPRLSPNLRFRCVLHIVE